MTSNTSILRRGVNPAIFTLFGMVSLARQPEIEVNTQTESVEELPRIQIHQNT